MIFKHSKYILGVALAALSVGFLSSQPTYADDKLPGYLQISPVSANIDLEPGTKYTGTFKVSNIGSDDVTYTTVALPYQVIGEEYNPDFTTENDYTRIVKWITFDKDGGTVKPNEYDTVTYTIDVPEDATGIGQYAAVGAQTITLGAGNIRTNNQVAMLLHAHVAGETNKCGKIVSSSIPTFMFNGPIKASALVENCGNIDQYASYTLKVWPLFSDEEIYDLEDNPEAYIILPDTKRFATISWDNSPSFGIYRVELGVDFAGEKKVFPATVIICPLWLIIIFLALIFVMIFWLVSRHKSRKRSAANAKVDSSEN